MKLISAALSPPKLSQTPIGFQVNRDTKNHEKPGPTLTVVKELCRNSWGVWPPGVEIKTIKYGRRAGGRTPHLIPQVKFKRVSTHKYKGEKLARSPVV